MNINQYLIALEKYIKIKELKVFTKEQLQHYLEKYYLGDFIYSLIIKFVRN